MSGSFSFVSVCLDPWIDVWNCYHQIMWRLAERHRVLFCGPACEARRIHRHPRRRSVRHLERNLHEYTAPWWLPHAGRWPLLDRVTRRLQAMHLRRTVDALGWDEPVLYVWHPAFAHLLEVFPRSIVVYHAYDDFTHYPMEEGWRSLLRRNERRLLERADLVFANGEAIRRELAAVRTDRVFSVPNAVSLDWFDAARHGGPPAEYAGLRRPILAYVGRLSAALVDLSLLHRLALARPDWTLALVGPWVDEPDPRPAARAALLALPNVVHVPPKRPQELPPYSLHADVCLMSYTMDDNVMRWAFPLKLFEYMASGRPVVSAPLPNLLSYVPALRVAATTEEWLAHIEGALAHDTPRDAEARIALARANTWEGRCHQILTYLRALRP